MDPFRRLAAISAGAFSDGTVAPPFVAGPRAGDAPLTYFQEMRWNRWRNDPADRYFLDGFGQLLVGRLDRGALAASLDALAARHDTLRTTYRLDQPIQQIAAHSAVALGVHDLRGASRADIDARATELLLAPLDITREPSYRPQLLQIADDEHLLVHGYHNFALNRPALAILISDWARCYIARRAGSEPPPPRGAFQFADFARWQRAWLVGPELDRRLARWSARLAASQAIRLPADHPRPATPQPCRLGYHGFPLPDALARDVIAFSRGRGTTFGTALAAFAALLHSRTGAPSVTLKAIAQTLHRSAQDIAGLLACLALVHVELGDDPPLSLVWERTNTALFDALEDQFLPWWRVPGAWIEVPDILVDAVPPSQQGTPWPDVTTSRYELGHWGQRPGRFDLEWFVWLRSEAEQHIGVEYNADLFEASTIARLGQDFHRTLRALITDPDQRLSQLTA